MEEAKKHVHTTDEIAYLRRIVEDNDNKIESFRARERNSIYITPAIIGLFLGFFAYTQKSWIEWNSDKVEEATSQAREQIATLIGSYRPNKSWSHGLDGDSSKEIQLELYIVPEKMGDVTVYTLMASGSYIVKIDGKSGRIVGNMSKIKGAGLDFFARNFDGSADEIRLKTQAIGNYRFQSGDNGLLVSEGAHINMTYRIGRNYVSCEEAQKGMEEVLRWESNDTTIEMKPVFFDINTLPRYEEFSVNFISGGGLACPSLELDNEKSATSSVD